MRPELRAFPAPIEDAVLLVGTSARGFDDFFDAVAEEAAAAGELTTPEIRAIVARVGAPRGIEIDLDRVPADARALYGLPSPPEAPDR